MKGDVEDRLLSELRHHFSGWRDKIRRDFSESNFADELSRLRSDSLYVAWGLDSPQYALIRLVGRMSISFGRRLGEIYDKIPRFVAAARFALSPEDIASLIDGLELDISIPLSKLTEQDRGHCEHIVRSHFKTGNLETGIGVEMRYNFNPNDSARLRKDVRMVQLLRREKYFPVYLIFSSISPRQEAISRLKRAGWFFLVGKDADRFMRELLEVDIASILDSPRLKREIKVEMDAMMKSIFTSPAFRSAIQHETFRASK